ncbi:DUF2267 domain-containing protein [Labrenzia sp. ac12]
MPMPQTYFRASVEFDAFIHDVRDTCMLQTHHQAYHTLRAVLHTFRDHLTTEQALAFANILPAVTRAIFVEDWHSVRPVATCLPRPGNTDPRSQVGPQASQPGTGQRN